MTNHDILMPGEVAGAENSADLVGKMLREPAAEARHSLPLSGRALEALLGRGEALLLLLERTLQVRLVPRDGRLLLLGEPPQVERAAAILRHLLQMAEGGAEIDEVAVNYQLAMWEQRLHGGRQNPEEAAQLSQVIYTTPKGRQIRPKSYGKTYLAVVKAADALRRRRVAKMVLVRPAVEAGEKLGFLPGDLQEKVNPYLRPIYDALDDTLGAETAAKYMERGLIEVVPLAYMRGRTLDASFIILDEAQNTTPPQMKMFLTRLGQGSKAVVTGDITQIDLPAGQKSGLHDAQQVLHGVPGLAFCYLTDLDVVRHPLVQKIIEAYARAEG